LGDYWNDASHFVIQWSMKYSEAYQVFISLDTSAGHRYMWYTPSSTDSLGSGEYVQFGLGSASYDGNWHTFQRDLAADLKLAQPSVTITDVNAFLIRGSGCIDDIKLLSYLSMKEDAEDGRTTGWDEYSGTGNVYNALVDGRRVIQLSGSGTSTGYRYPYSTSDYWNDASHFTNQWSMKYSENYRIYISLDSTDGHRYMTYDPVDVDNLGTGEYVYHGLGSDSYDGTWRTFTRDLLADLREAQPAVDIINVDAILIRGSGYIDDIKLLPHNSQASLVVPAGQSYIQPSIISRPGSDGWYGGTFVRALDRPFRLYQLSEFSMHGIVDQVSSDRMGKTFVGLFDENMKCVFWIYMGDSWGGSTQGYFNTAFYPEAGGSYYQQSGNIYTDFDKVGCLWYDRGTNSIKSTMTGNDVITLATADSPERVIMYLVVTAQAYDGYGLLDMRIHDINIRVNVRTTPPNIEEPPPGEDPSPVVYDGAPTAPDSAPKGGKQNADDTLSLFTAALEVFWQLVNWWPRLFFRLIDEIHSAFNVLVSTDFFGDMQVHTLSIVSSIENEASEAELQSVAEQAESGWGELIVRFLVPVGFSIGLKFLLSWIENLASPLALTTSLVTMLAMLGAWVLLFVAYVAWIQWSVENGFTHPYSAAAGFLSLMLMLFPGIDSALAAGWVMYRLWKACQPFPMAPAGFGRGIWFIALALVKIAVVLVCAFYVGWYLAMGWYT
jgi:hypothetical protein